MAAVGRVAIPGQAEAAERRLRQRGQAAARLWCSHAQIRQAVRFERPVGITEVEMPEACWFPAADAD